MLVWLLIASALLIALWAWAAARGNARKLEQLNHAYWELRYEHTRLRARVNRLDPESEPAAAPDTPQSPTQVAFVPLASLKGKRE
jgi:hypothetical protein